MAYPFALMIASNHQGIKSTIFLVASAEIFSQSPSNIFFKSHFLGI